MLKAWDTLVGEARCLFTASVEGGEPEELCEGLVRQVSKLAVDAGGPGTTCRAAPTDYGSIILEVDTRDGSTEAIKEALKGKTLIVKGARCVLGLAAAAVRLPCTKNPVEMRPVVEKPHGSMIKDVSEDDWRRLRRLFGRRAEVPGDKRDAWARALRDAGRAYADRPWAECRWHPPTREPLIITGPSFFAAPKKQEAKEADSKADAKGDAKESDDGAKDDVAEAKGAEPWDERAATRRATMRRRRLMDNRQPWRLDPRAPVDDKKTVVVDENVPPATTAPPEPAPAPQKVSSVFAATRAVAALTPKNAAAPDVPTVAARLAARRRSSLCGNQISGAPRHRRVVTHWLISTQARRASPCRSAANSRCSTSSRGRCRRAAWSWPSRRAGAPRRRTPSSRAAGAPRRGSGGWPSRGAPSRRPGAF